MNNNKIKVFEVQQVDKMRKQKTVNKINFNKDKFFTGDFVSINLKLKNAKGEEYTKHYMDGIVVKGNTKHTKSSEFTAIPSDLNVNNVQSCVHLKPNNYITIGSIINTINRVSMKVRINQPNIEIKLVRSAKRKTGALVKGSGRVNLEKQFMDDKVSVSRLKKMFKNTLTTSV